MRIGRKIGEGANAEVYEWEDSKKVIKLAKTNITKTDLQREFKNNLVAWKLGLPAPQPYEVVEFNQRPGIVYERIHGKMLSELFFESLILQTNTDLPQFPMNNVKLTARLLAKVHHHVANQEILTNQREFLKHAILNVDYLNEDEKRAVLDVLARLPQKNSLCHGDVNPNNILISSGEPILIDWMNAANGNPEADLAEFIIMIRYAILPPDIPQNAVRLFDDYREIIIKEFMNEYTQLTGTTYEEVDPWIVPLAARKLSSDGIEEAEKQLLVKVIQSRLDYIRRGE